MTPTHVLVPVEPTEAMIEAACVASFGPNVPKDSITALWRSGLLGIYRAMLAAAPRAPDDVAERVLAVIIAAHDRHHRSALIEPAEWLVEAARDVADQQIAENANCSPDREKVLIVALQHLLDGRSGARDEARRVLAALLDAKEG